MCREVGEKPEGITGPVLGISGSRDKHDRLGALNNIQFFTTAVETRKPEVKVPTNSVLG